MMRSASAPAMRPQSGKAGSRPSSAGGLHAYRSKAIELEVRLRQQLADAWVQGGDGQQLPPSAALTDANAAEVPTTMTVPKLQVYSDLFEAIIESDDAFAPLLRKVKDIYDATAEPLMYGGRATQDGSTTPDPSATGDEGGDERVVDLALENRLLRKMAGRLHNEREQLRVAREAEEARRKQKRPSNSKEFAALAGLLPLGGGVACKDWLRRETPQSRPFSAMRITSHGVKTAQVW